ncbi:MAG TPA: GDSL-type esterase/lipase family protein [Verrucomicrobiae bacterium]|nr:GDSL-type esterase/lipase family protein [Verrucomicrobiae bacterium]
MTERSSLVAQVSKPAVSQTSPSARAWCAPRVRKPALDVQFALLAILFACLSGCSTVDQREARPLRILPVGDSITAGYTDNPAWRTPFEFGYREPLFQLLRSNRIAFRFVGDSQEPWNGLWKVPTNSPKPDLRCFGQDHHEGYGAKGTAFVAQHIGRWMETHQPDIVLLMIGINDIAAGSTNPPAAAITNLQRIVDTIATIRPRTHVIVAENIPYTKPTPAMVELNRFICETLVPAARAQGRNVSSVDHYSMMVSGSDPLTGDRRWYSNGWNHPNAAAYHRMAQSWFEEIRRVAKVKVEEPR